MGASGRLEERGWVSRQECPTDRRGTFAELTEAGMAQLEAAAPTHVEGVRRHLIDLVGRDELLAWRAALDRVIEHLSGEHAGPDPN